MRRPIWKVLSSSSFDAIILNYVQFGDWVPAGLKSKTILFTHDIYYYRWASLSGLPLSHSSVANIRRIEYDEFSKYPLLLTVTDYELDILSRDFDRSVLFNIGAPQVIRSCSKQFPKYRFGFLGANAIPNSRGILQFLSEWWPIPPSSTLSIAGDICSNPEVSNCVSALGGDLQVLLMILIPFIRCRWILAPIYQVV